MARAVPDRTGQISLAVDEDIIQWNKHRGMNGRRSHSSLQTTEVDELLSEKRRLSESGYPNDARGLR